MKKQLTIHLSDGEKMADQRMIVVKAELMVFIKMLGILSDIFILCNISHCRISIL